MSDKEGNIVWTVSKSVADKIEKGIMESFNPHQQKIVVTPPESIILPKSGQEKRRERRRNKKKWK